MSGESLSLGLPLPRFATRTAETIILYRKLRKPLLRYWCRSASRPMRHRMWFRTFSSACSGTWPPADRRKIFGAGCTGWRITRRGTARRATTGGLPRRSTAKSKRCSTRGRRNERSLKRKSSEGWASAIRLLSRARARMSAAARRGITLPRDWRGLGDPTSTVGDTVERAIKKLSEKCNV